MLEFLLSKVDKAANTFMKMDVTKQVVAVLGVVYTGGVVSATYMAYRVRKALKNAVTKAYCPENPEKLAAIADYVLPGIWSTAFSVAMMGRIGSWLVAKFGISSQQQITLSHLVADIQILRGKIYDAQKSGGTDTHINAYREKIAKKQQLFNERIIEYKIDATGFLSSEKTEWFNNRDYVGARFGIFFLLSEGVGDAEHAKRLVKDGKDVSGYDLMAGRYQTLGFLMLWLLDVTKGGQKISRERFNAMFEKVMTPWYKSDAAKFVDQVINLEIKETKPDAFADMAALEKEIELERDAVGK